MTTGTFPWPKKWSNRPSKINLSFFFDHHWCTNLNILCWSFLDDFHCFFVNPDNRDHQKRLFSTCVENVFHHAWCTNPNIFCHFCWPPVFFSRFASVTLLSTVSRVEGTVRHPNVLKLTRFDRSLSSWYGLVKRPPALLTLAAPCCARIENLTSVAGVSIDLLSIICDQLGSRLLKSVTLWSNNATLGPTSTCGVF